MRASLHWSCIFLDIICILLACALPNLDVSALQNEAMFSLISNDGVFTLSVHVVTVFALSGDVQTAGRSNMFLFACIIIAWGTGEHERDHAIWVLESLAAPSDFSCFCINLSRKMQNIMYLS